jgi:tetratricopeptide (TPR) repeat protein
MVVKHYLPQLPDGLSGRDNADYTDLLDWLYLTAPRDTELAKLYAEQLLRVRRFADALPILVQLMPESPGIGLKAAVISRGLGYETRAAGYAKQSLDEFVRLREKEPSRADLAVALAECNLFLNQYAEAAAVLRHALELNKHEKESEQLRNLLAHSFVIWANSFARKPQKTAIDRLQSLKLLQNALTIAPNHPLVLQMVADQVLEVIDETDSEIVALRQSLVLGTSPGVSHFIRGTAAVLKGDIQAAEMHLEIASKTLPMSDVILNNLACVIYQKEGGDLERALALSETAIKRNPNPAPHYLETRGQILRKLERWIDAIPDLEAALAVPALAAEAHRGLAECFENLGDKELSDQHRQAAERIARAPKSS